MSATSEIKVEIQYGYYSEKQKNMSYYRLEVTLNYNFTWFKARIV